eukprot:Gregarina_sp_Poly_1__2445@NODE_165_length_12211_cov_32_860425_g147_i0_p4_GENE_NODE_165_length_12211_cov_32_860425_g147_i0NODE_165_length_12211_cov_32_860425_g147_i0_p4_ORF_typecomplete_len227_score33_10_NODE_165_length_12211_cov_32_860425_g147_i0240920
MFTAAGGAFLPPKAVPKKKAPVKKKKESDGGVSRADKFIVRPAAAASGRRTSSVLSNLPEFQRLYFQDNAKTPPESPSMVPNIPKVPSTPDVRKLKTKKHSVDSIQPSSSGFSTEGDRRSRRSGKLQPDSPLVKLQPVQMPPIKKQNTQEKIQALFPPTRLSSQGYSRRKHKIKAILAPGRKRATGGDEASFASFGTPRRVRLSWIVGSVCVRIHACSIQHKKASM